MRWTVPRWPLPASSTPRWLAAYVLLNLATAVIPPARHIPPISPATLVYAPQDAALPLLLSSFLVPSFQALLSRALQITWLYSHLTTTSGPSGTAVQPRQLLTNYASLLALRSLLGFVFTRSVGWKYPELLAPYALYEPIYGIGPLIVDAVLFGQGLAFGKISAYETLLRFALLAVSAMLDGMPWSYACAAAIAGLCRLVHTWTARSYSESVSPAYTPVRADDEEDIMLPLPSPYFRPPGGPSRSYTSHSRSRVVLTTFIAIAACWLSGSTPQYLQSSIFRPHDTPLTPSVHILMLTYPRDKDPTSDYMIDSIQSYLAGWAGARLAPANTTLTVYAHAGPDGRHRAWGRARMFFDETHGERAPGPELDFVMHPQDGAPPSHYAHLADALRYAYAKAHEWTMVVEDDFALCGAWGAQGVARVLKELGSTLVDGDADEVVFPGIVDESGDVEQKRARWRGAFVGTGGSGLILHHTLLPTLIVLLDLIPTLTASLAPYPQTPPDVLIQQCLSGEIALCSAILSSPPPSDDPSSPSSPSDPTDTPARSPYPALPRAVPVPDLPPALTPSAPPAFLVPARMLMAHTGHALSTGGRTYAAGQWACRWRQPMLGNRGVSVLVV